MPTELSTATVDPPVELEEGPLLARGQGPVGKGVKEGGAGLGGGVSQTTPSHLEVWAPSLVVSPELSIGG